MGSILSIDIMQFRSETGRYKSLHERAIKRLAEQRRVFEEKIDQLKDKPKGELDVLKAETVKLKRQVKTLQDLGRKCPARLRDIRETQIVGTRMDYGCSAKPLAGTGNGGEITPRARLCPLARSVSKTRRGLFGGTPRREMAWELPRKRRVL